MRFAPFQKAAIRIAEYQPQYAQDFHDLNYAWLNKYFEIEPFDRLILNDPDTHIIQQGGFVLFALEGNRVVGTCALLKHAERKYELAKMTVLDEVTGRGIGNQLITAAIEKARALGVSELVLATSDKLKAANHLYQKKGFVYTDPSVIGPLPYKRKTVVMHLNVS